MAEPSCPTELPQPHSCLPSEDRPFAVFLQRAVEGKEVDGIFLLSVFSNTHHHHPHKLQLSAGSLPPVLILATRPLPGGIPSPLLHTHFVSHLGIPAGLLLAEGCLLEGSPPSAWRQHCSLLSFAETSLAQKASHVQSKLMSLRQKAGPVPCQARLRRGTLCLGKCRGLS